MEHFYIIALLFCGCSCVPQDKRKEKDRQLENDAIRSFVNLHVQMKKVNSLMLYGDFDGNGSIDSLKQLMYSDKSRSVLDSVADPMNTDWDTVVNWFSHNYVNVLLVLNKGGDTLRFGNAQGLNTLINTGDLNQDGKDEIALVVDWFDYSNMNSCKIYTLYDERWVELKQFQIHESAFEEGQEVDPAVGIKDWLINKEGKWYYTDYVKSINDGIVEMKELNIESVNESR